MHRDEHSCFSPGFYVTETCSKISLSLSLSLSLFLSLSVYQLASTKPWKGMGATAELPHQLLGDSGTWQPMDNHQ